MKRSLVLGTVSTFAVAVLLLGGCGEPAGRSDMPEAPNEPLTSLNGEPIPIEELEAFIEETMEKANVAGLSCAIINHGEVVFRRTFGYKDMRAGTMADEETVFSAASLSKPVFAYLAMLQVEDGIIDLDKPLHEYLKKPLYAYPAYADLKEDEHHKQITARHVLSHGTGFPNWRFLTQDGRLNIMFSPGERCSYSGEGIALLQMVVEEITGRNLEDLAQEKIFGPLEMTRSSYVWKTCGNKSRGTLTIE